jgi:hypothetical protein
MKSLLLLQAITTLEATPQLDIKSYKGSEFGSISDVVTFKNGNIAVIDNSYLKVSFFDSKGSPISTVGTEGQGPGEFKLILPLGECRENVLTVYDPNNNKVVDISAEGKILKTKLATDVFRVRPYKVSCNRAGQLLLIEPPVKYLEPKFAEGPYRDSMAVIIQNRNSKVSVGNFPGDERYLWIISKTRMTGAPRPSGNRLVTVIDDNIFVGTTDSLYVEIFNLAGKKIGVIKHKTPVKKITAKDHKRIVEEEAEDRKISIATSERMIGTALPEFLPAYERIVPSKDRLWVQLSHTDTDIQWLGFDLTGKLVANLTVPSNFKVLKFDDKSALGIWTDSELAESVRHFRLRVKL